MIEPQPAPEAPGRGRLELLRLGLAFAAIYVVWGSTYLAIRYVVETIPPLLAAGLRHTLAGGFLLAVAWHRGYRPRREHWAAGALLGALFFLIGHGTLHWAEQRVSSGASAMLVATEPMFILVIGWAAGQRRISLTSTLGLGLGMLGVALLVTGEASGKGSNLSGMLAVLVGALAWSLGVVASPRLKLPDDALARTALPLVCGAAMLLATAGFTGEFQAVRWSGISLRSALGLGYLVVFGTIVAFTAYTWLLQRCSPALVATHTYANPVVALLLGWLLASEPLTARIGVASAAILGAVLLVRKGEREADSPQGAATEAERRQNWAQGIPLERRGSGPTPGDPGGQLDG